MGKPSGGRGHGALVVGEGGEGLSVRREDADDVHEARVLAAPGGRGGIPGNHPAGVAAKGGCGDTKGTWGWCRVETMCSSRNWTQARGKIKKSGESRELVCCV